MINFNLLFLVLFIAVISYVAYTLFIKKEKNDNANTENTSQDSTPEDSNEKPQGGGSFTGTVENKLAFIGGILLILFINSILVICFGIMFGLSGLSLSYNPSTGPNPLFFIFGLFSAMIGIGQLLYVIPWVIKLKKSGEPMLANGIIVGAVITALLNGGCYLTMLK